VTKPASPAAVRRRARAPADLAPDVSILVGRLRWDLPCNFGPELPPSRSEPADRHCVLTDKLSSDDAVRRAGARGAAT
jgi:hypothetical protein